MISGGFISELSFISLAYGLLHVRNEIEADKYEDAGATKRGADYKVSKQLNRRINTLKTELWDFMAKYAEHSDRILSRNERLLDWHYQKCITLFSLIFGVLGAILTFSAHRAR